MPFGEDEVEDLPLDAGSENDQDAAQKPDSAASSDAHDAPKTDEDLLSVAREVISGKVKTGEAASSAEASEAGSEPASQVRKEPDDVEYTDVPFHKHPRFQQVLGRMKASETDAGRYRNVTGFIESQGLSADSAAEALTIAGMMRNDPAEAWKRLQPMLSDLLVRAGEALPPELQQRVDAGQLDPAAALEISRATATTKSLEQRQADERARQERQQQTDFVTSLSTAADQWETDRQSKDPNFAAKRPALEREVLYLQRTEGMPTTADAVRAQLKRAYDAVNKDFRPPQPPAPRRQATRPVTGGQTAGAAATRPINGSTLDIVRQIANRAAS